MNSSMDEMKSRGTDTREVLWAHFMKQSAGTTLAVKKDHRFRPDGDSCQDCGLTAEAIAERKSDSPSACYFDGWLLLKDKICLACPPMAWAPNGVKFDSLTSGGIKPEGETQRPYDTPEEAIDAYKEQLSKRGRILYIRQAPELSVWDGKFSVYSRLIEADENEIFVRFVTGATKRTVELQAETIDIQRKYIEALQDQLNNLLEGPKPETMGEKLNRALHGFS